MANQNKTYKVFRYFELNPGPLNPRRLFDKYKLDVLEESIRANRILVPLMVYQNDKDGKIYILDGERRWRCAQRIENGEVSVELESYPKGLVIPEKLEKDLTYDPNTRVLTHHKPISVSRKNELEKLVDTGTWKSIVEELYELSVNRPPKPVDVPVNIVDSPTPSANMLYMFHVHNLREQWELMPTALSLQILIGELGTEDENKLAQLTNLSTSHVRRCLILLKYPKKYQMMMLDPDPTKRIKANLFTEMYPVLNLYKELGPRVSGGKTRNELIDLFIEKYRKGLIPSVINFRRILEAHDLLQDSEDYIEVKEAARRFVKEPDTKIKTLFDPLVAEEKHVKSASELCKSFIKELKALKIAHVSKRRSIITALNQVQDEVKNLLDVLSGEE